MRRKHPQPRQSCPSGARWRWLISLWALGIIAIVTIGAYHRHPSAVLIKTAVIGTIQLIGFCLTLKFIHRRSQKHPKVEDDNGK